MNIHAANLRGPADSSPGEGAPRPASLRAAGRARSRVVVERGQRGTIGCPRVQSNPRSSGPDAPARLPVPGDRLVSRATVLLLFIGTLSGPIIRSLPRLLLLAVVGK